MKLALLMLLACAHTAPMPRPQPQCIDVPAICAKSCAAGGALPARAFYNFDTDFLQCICAVQQPSPQAPGGTQ